MNKLKYLSAYLAGPIDRCPDFGTEWREYVTEELEKRFNVFVLNPRKKEEILDGGEENAESITRLRNLKEDGKFDLLAEKFKEIRLYDLRMVEKADFIIAHLDLDIFTCGTFEEIFKANIQRKPIIIHCPQGKKSVPNWLFGTLHHEYFCNSWEEVFSLLSRVNNGELTSKRWVFFEFQNLLNKLTAF